MAIDCYCGDSEQPDNPHDTVMVRLGPGFLDLVALLVQQSGDLESVKCM